MADIYYVKRGSKLFGPYTYEQVTNCIRKDIIGEEDLISSNKITWVKIRDFLKELNAPAAPPSEVSNEMPQNANPAAQRVIKLQYPQQCPPQNAAHNLNTHTPVVPEMPMQSGSSFDNIYRDFHFKDLLEGACQRAVMTFTGSFILFCITLVISGLGERFDSVELSTTGLFLLLVFFIVYTIFFIFGMIALYRSWKTLLPHEASTTPGKAVGFLFIPFFNLYWIFVAFYSFATDVNKKNRRYGYMLPANEGAILSECIVYLLILLANIILSCFDTEITTSIASFLNLVNMLVFGACICQTSKAAVRFYNNHFASASGSSMMMNTPQMKPAPSFVPNANDAQSFVKQSMSASGNPAIRVLVSQLSMYTNNIQVINEDTVIVSGMAAHAFGSSLCNDQTVIRVLPVSNDFCNYVPQTRISYSGLMIFWLIFGILTGLIFLLVAALIYHSCQNTIKNNINQAINNAMLQLRQY